MMAEMGTPLGLSHSFEIDGHWRAGTVNRELGCAAFPLETGVQRFPCQSTARAGGSPSIPSHHGWFFSLMAVFVKMAFRFSIAIAFGLVLALVPGATPKKPASGLIARKWLSASGFSHAMSSPTVQTFQPSNPAGGMSIAKFVFPQADGNAAAT